MKAASK